MSRKIVFISDFFVEQIIGGGELNDDELIKILISKGREVEKIQSHLVTQEFLNNNKDSFFVISNFCNLSYDCRELITYDFNYLIYEHDHKYLESRNPINYDDFKAPCTKIRNYFFYKNAKKIFCQSNFHKGIIFKNLDFDNIISVSGNLWSTEVLDKLEEHSKKVKSDKVSVLDSHIEHKNTFKTVLFCKKKGLKHELVKDNNYEKFLDKMSNNSKLAFFPGSPETLSRVVCEARMMGMGIMINNLVGASHESWFNLKGVDLINYMRERRDIIPSLILEEADKEWKKLDRKTVSIITTFHKADEFLEDYLQNITNQTHFDKCELVLIDSASPGNEQETVKKYMRMFDNIKYHRFDYNFKPTIGHNLAIKKSTSKYVVWAMIDDRKSIDGIEALFNELDSDLSLELVYGDCLVTDKKNETVETTSSKKLAEHSVMEFSRENMIKCLPGPMPMWRKRLHEKCGFFDEVNHDFSDDWDLWLRAVNKNCKFKKVKRVVGLYMEGGRSQWENNIDQRIEEANIFFKNAHVFGQNFQKYQSYFSQFKG